MYPTSLSGLAAGAKYHAAVGDGWKRIGHKEASPDEVTFIRDKMLYFLGPGKETFMWTQRTDLTPKEIGERFFAVARQFFGQTEEE